MSIISINFLAIRQVSVKWKYRGKAVAAPSIINAQCSKDSEKTKRFETGNHASVLLSFCFEGNNICSTKFKHAFEK